MMWDLSDPVQCRDFLKKLRVGPNGEACTHVYLADGTELTIDEASDEQIVTLCTEMAETVASQENQA